MGLGLALIGGGTWLERGPAAAAIVVGSLVIGLTVLAAFLTRSR